MFIQRWARLSTVNEVWRLVVPLQDVKESCSWTDVHYHEKAETNIGVFGRGTASYHENF